MNPERILNLENTNKKLSTVQVSREMMTDSGCSVTMLFPEISDSQIRRDVARMLLAAFEKRRTE